MYKSYLAGNREPRFGAQFVNERSGGGVWDSTLGARVGLLRFGTDNDFWPQGWQLDVEGAAFPWSGLRAGGGLKANAASTVPSFGIASVRLHPAGEDFQLCAVAPETEVAAAMHWKALAERSGSRKEVNCHWPRRAVQGEGASGRRMKESVK